VSAELVPRVCILIPTYDNGRTLQDVVQRAVKTGLEVLVVDDGSNDGTPEILASIPGLVVHRHARNRGKGAALESGFRIASERGFTHVISLDSDGQHLPEDAPLLLAALREQPEALIVGARDLVAAGAGRGSRLGCRLSNLWLHLETGVRLPDTQTGMRAYPLQSVRALSLKDSGFGFEIEVLVKTSWTGVPLTSVPVRVLYPRGAERVSHFRPILDSLRIARLNAHLCFLRICLPAPFLALVCLRSFRELSLRERIERGSKSLLLEGHGSTLCVAGSVGLGLFMGITPLWGFQVPLTLGLAHAFRASKAVALLAAQISFPLMIPPILYASLVLGRWLLGDASATGLGFERADTLNWFVGSFALAALVSLAGFGITLIVLSGARKSLRKWKTE